MKFRFCGDLDCPDWLLAEIATLAKLTSIKIKLLCNQVINDIRGEDINYDKVSKLTADAKFESDDIKASVAALTFILTSAAKYSVEEVSLSNELQQLGLPKEHATSLCKAYSDNLQKLKDELRKKSLRLSQLDSVDWRVDYVLSSSELSDVNKPNIQLKLNVKNVDSKKTEPIVVNMADDKFRVLLNELKQAYSIMETVSQ